MRSKFLIIVVLTSMLVGGGIYALFEGRYKVVSTRSGVMKIDQWTGQSWVKSTNGYTGAMTWEPVEH